MVAGGQHQGVRAGFRGVGAGKPGPKLVNALLLATGNVSLSNQGKVK